MILPAHLHTWLNDNAKKLKSERYITDHLTLTPIKDHEYISSLIEKFVSFSGYLEKEYPDFGMMIVLNLKTLDETKLCLKPPENVDALVADLDTSPPTLYVTRPDLKSVWDTTEEYRVPVKFLNRSMIRSVSTAYYREFRDEQGIEQNWEFTRSIYLEYFSLNSR